MKSSTLQTTSSTAGINAGNDGIYGNINDFYATTADPNIAMNGGHADADADNNKDLLDKSHVASDFSAVDFGGGLHSDFVECSCSQRRHAVSPARQSYAGRERDQSRCRHLSRIMDADMAYMSPLKMAQQNVLLQAGASMVTQANQLFNIVLSLLCKNGLGTPKSSKIWTTREDYGVSIERKMIGLPAYAYFVPPVPIGITAIRGNFLPLLSKPFKGIQNSPNGLNVR